MYEWSDLRLFLAVARAGSTLAASRALNVNQTTVTRRIAALEHALGIVLFLRSPRGYSLTLQGKSMVRQAEEVEAAALRLRSEASRLGRDLTGSIRVTATHPIMRHLVSPAIQAYRQMHPEVTFEILSSAARLNLQNGEADVAFRSARSIEGDALVAARLPDITATAYCSDAYRERHGAPSDPAGIAGHDVMVYQGTPGMELFTAWLRAWSAPDRIVGSMNAPEDMVSAILSGMGVSVLPCFLGDATPGLRRCFDPVAELDRSWWVVSGPEASRQPRVRSFTAYAAEYIRLNSPGVRGAGAMPKQKS